MTTPTTKAAELPQALRLADELRKMDEAKKYHPSGPGGQMLGCEQYRLIASGFTFEHLQSAAAELRRLHAQVEALSAGGVSGPLMGQPQEMPDLSALTERGAKAWAGVDARELREGFTAADMATASAQGLRDGVVSVAASAGSEPVAIRPDIQAVLAMLDVPVIARMSSHEGKLLKPGQEPPAFESAVPLVREWDHRRACEKIIAALSGNN